MKEIYKTATEVLVDLGERDAESDLIFSQIANLMRGQPYEGLSKYSSEGDGFTVSGSSRKLC